MKKIILLVIFLMVTLSNFADSVLSLNLNQVKSLSPDKQNEFWATVHQQILISKEVEIEGGEIRVDLVFSHQNLTNSPQIRLVAHINDKEYIIWWADTGFGIPKEEQFEIGGNGYIVGLCFNCNPKILLFYEVDVKRALMFAKSANNLITPSAWIMDDLLNTNDNRQMYLLRNLLETKDYSAYIRDVELHCVGDKWIFSGVIKGLKTPEAKVFYQYPVGGKGLTFLKSEPVPPVSESMTKCQSNLAKIEFAKEAWAADNGKKQGDTVDTNELFSVYLKGKDIKCPDGGVYDIGKVGEPPKCFIHGVFQHFPQRN